MKLSHVFHNPVERFHVPLLCSEQLFSQVFACIFNGWNLTAARLPTLAADVAKLVPASADHVVAAAGDQVDDLIAALTALPALLVG